MKKALITCLASCMFLWSFSQDAGQRQKLFNLDGGLAIKGYDPVAYFSTNKAVKGDKQWALSDAMGKEGSKVDVDPGTFKIVNGKLFLFYNQFFNNTLKSWNKDEENLHRSADANWQKLIH